ncbi:transglycosylase domain-containing protein [Streptomyces sp. VRA16 Mangrove soil]|uniref:transglycosylase domain-containing protein n=1 Tax=Streptomyces sp. VRA16 Mangrove soil TaxID=2817434 RepID=UPI001A9E97D4|nr:transglycosylase domain-containing protein [Streptomyces sp. VRA16 Mangrove soil]MBO1334640.1 penicillin-binding protein [Streptomyces sp. VRA16 Mangrove soil]
MGRAEERRARQRGGTRRAAPAQATGHRAESGRMDRRRGGRAGKDDRSFIRRLFTWKKVLGTIFGFVLLCMGAFVVLYMVIDVPNGNSEAKLQSNIFKYSDGTTMARTGTVNREIVDLAEIPQPVQHTFVAAENKSFYDDSGVDLKGTARGLVNTLSGKGKQGGSTITQQYVKNYYLTQDQTVTRKLKELVITLKLEQKKSKDEILAGYINTSYYGRGAWGIQAAAQAYYGKDASKLTVQQGAYLAALLQAPSQYDWSSATDTGRKLAKARWNYVLDNMVEKHWLDASKREGMTFPKPNEPKAASGFTGQEGYLYEAAKAEVIKDLNITEDQFNAGGYTVTLNIDPKKQKALEKSVKDQLTANLEPKTRKADARVQAGAVSVDPKTGRIVAMYGGAGQSKHWSNNATRTDYQPASTFKPLILAAALQDQATTQSGQQIKASTVYDGTSKRPVVLDDKKVGFAPPNEDDHDYGQVTVQTAMNKSINSVFAQMGADVGMDKVMETAKQLGMDSADLKPYYAQTLGTMGASPLEMAGVYATLDNHGKKVTPQIVKSVSTQDGRSELPDAIGGQVIDRGVADSVTSVLTGVVDDGTAKTSVRDNPARDGQQVAGKTGTSDDNKSAWFTGYTPDLVTSVGLFGEGAQKTADAGKQVSMKGAGGLPRVDGGSFPARIWAQYMFNSTSSNSKFDLDTDMGAGVEPTTTAPVTPSQEPTTEAPSETPTTPSQTPTTEAPTETPTTEPPTQEPTTEEPTDPGGGVTDSPTIELPGGGGNGRGNQG